MSFATARRLFSIIFIMATFGAAIVNAIYQYPAFHASINSLVPPKSLNDIRYNIGIIESAANNNVEGKPYFFDGFAYIHLLLGKKEMSDFGQVRSENGALNYGNPFPVDTGKVRQYARRVQRLNQAAEAGGAKMIFLNPADLVIRGLTRFEPGMPYQDLNIMQDAFLNCLREYGVDFLDTRYSLLDNGLPLDKFAYKTDHHWTVEAAFEVFRDLVGALEDKYNAGIDPEGFYRDHNNYEFKTYPGIFVGSLGRTTGLVYSGLEDFTLIYPKFESEYTVEMIDLLQRYLRRSGPADKSIFYTAALNIRDPYMMLPYSFYLTGISAWVKIVNHKNPDGPKLLLIHDSYSTPLACFLAPLFSEIHMVWPLAANSIQVNQYMAENKFDYVVLELFSANISEEGMHFFLNE